MSNLSTTLQSLLDRAHMTAAELSRASGVPEPKISRWLNDTQTYISDEDLEALALQVSTRSRERAELIVARLKDNLVGPGAEFVDITITGAALPDRSRFDSRLPAELQEALPLFVANWKDPDVRNLIIGLKNLLSRGDCALNSSPRDPDDSLVSETVHRDARPRPRSGKKK